MTVTFFETAYLYLYISVYKKRYRPSIKLDYLTEVLAYESVDKCKEDLLKYKLIIQSVPIVNSSESASGSSPLTTTTTTSWNSSNHKFTKTPKSTSTTTTSTKNNQTNFEEVLDCKQSTLQGL